MECFEFIGIIEFQGRTFSLSLRFDIMNHERTLCVQFLYDKPPIYLSLSPPILLRLLERPITVPNVTFYDAKLQFKL